MRRTVQLLAGIALLGACGSEPTATETNLAALRAATDGFHRIDVAQAAGYDAQSPAGCFTNAAGAMGLHYLNGTKVGTLNVSQPQLLMYEPQQNGTMKLVGVEFIVPGAPADPPPVLFDQAMHYNATFGVWVLHVWAWQSNPRGIYADWNPQVTCAHATTVVSAVSHH